MSVPYDDDVNKKYNRALFRTTRFTPIAAGCLFTFTFLVSYICFSVVPGFNDALDQRIDELIIAHNHLAQRVNETAVTFAKARRSLRQLKADGDELRKAGEEARGKAGRDHGDSRRVRSGSAFWQEKALITNPYADLAAKEEWAAIKGEFDEAVKPGEEQLAKSEKEAKEILAKIKLPAARSEMEILPEDEGFGEEPGPPADKIDDPEDWQGLEFDELNKKRQEQVKKEFLHSWKNYKKYAWGKDELNPQTMKGTNWGRRGNPNGLGLTILDSLSVMHLMGLEDELEEAMKFVKDDLHFNKDIEMSVFESTIRILGGLLSLFELTGEKHQYLLDKAVDIADKLLWAYNTSGAIPHQTVNLKTHQHWNPHWLHGASILSEFGTVQLEMRTLSYHTKNPIYDIKATHIMAVIKSLAPPDGLCPIYLTTSADTWLTDKVTLGALGDSYYEYLLKQYILTGKTEKRYKDMFRTAARGIMKKLVAKSSKHKWTFVAEYGHGRRRDKMDHLACFTGGMLALGAQVMFEDDERKEIMDAAGGIAETCYEMYHQQQSGVSPETVDFVPGRDFVNGPSFYILRPEAAEALFYNWRFTKDKKYREMGWFMFSHIMKHCRHRNGYVGIKRVNRKKTRQDDQMQSFWMAETLKYFYLLFSDDETFDLEKWVLNTEGHPLKVRSRDPMDVWREWEEEHGKVPWMPPTIDNVKPIETAKMKKAREQLPGKKVIAKVDPYSIEEGF